MNIPFFDYLFLFFTRLGDYGTLWIAVILVLLIKRDTRHIGIAAAVALILSAFTANVIIKHIVNRPRPFSSMDLHILIPAPTSPSFPSGHSATAFGAATALSRLKRGKLFFIPAALISLSRVYLLVHYPTDVLGGAVIGIACGLAAVCILERPFFVRLLHNTGKQFPG
ncbi:MAG: phosphatase PAP2 family protein [Oscillospiraceae bacterium]|jgi:undecaprenyl-diphosphatase|nr:phosphatase PAP2 family protein [Oscillospiraceae bacterium]